MPSPGLKSERRRRLVDVDARCVLPLHYRQNQTVDCSIGLACRSSARGWRSGNAEEDRVEILTSHPVTELLRDDDGRVVGVLAAGPEGRGNGAARWLEETDVSTIDEAAMGVGCVAADRITLRR
jgi:hypothetical protein